MTKLPTILSGVSTRVRLKLMQDAVRYWESVGQLMGRMHTVQDVVRTHTVRQELASQLYLNETERQVDQIERERHQRTLLRMHRDRTVAEADLEFERVRQKREALEEFKAHKFHLGAARFA